MNIMVVDCSFVKSIVFHAGSKHLRRYLLLIYIGTLAKTIRQSYFSIIYSILIRNAKEGKLIFIY